MWNVVNWLGNAILVLFINTNNDSTRTRFPIADTGRQTWDLLRCKPVSVVQRWLQARRAVTKAMENKEPQPPVQDPLSSWSVTSEPFLSRTHLTPGRPMAVPPGSYLNVTAGDWLKNGRECATLASQQLTTYGGPLFRNCCCLQVARFWDPTNDSYSSGTGVSGSELLILG